MTNNNSTKSETQMAEAPASWNTKYISPEGFECQLTLRAESGSELLEKVNSAIAYLLGNDCVPYVYSRGGYQGKSGNGKPKQAASENTTGNGKSNNPSWCPIHECGMKKWEKDGRVWYNHKVNSDWRNGK